MNFRNDFLLVIGSCLLGLSLSAVYSYYQDNDVFYRQDSEASYHPVNFGNNSSRDDEIGYRQEIDAKDSVAVEADISNKEDAVAASVVSDKENADKSFNDKKSLNDNKKEEGWWSRLIRKFKERRKVLDTKKSLKKSESEDGVWSTLIRHFE